jgi:hypothetical protein
MPEEVGSKVNLDQFPSQLSPFGMCPMILLVSWDMWIHGGDYFAGEEKRALYSLQYKAVFSSPTN